MAKLKILTGENNEVLRAVSKPVVKFDSKLKKLVKDMKEVLVSESGLGLAAPQVGENLRVFVIVYGHKTKEERVIAMINPLMKFIGEETVIAEEGCLSLPGKWGNVLRYVNLEVEFFDVDGVRQILNLSDLNAREVQHEYDHLDGVLFVDKIVEEEGSKEEAEVM